MMQSQISTIRTILLLIILGIAGLNGFSGKALAAEDEEPALPEEAITLEELQQLEPFPEFFEQMSPEGRLDWLNSQIDQAATPVESYNFQRVLAFEHFFNFRNSEAQEVCQTNPPLSFDLRYRFACIQVSDISYDNRLDNLLKLYQDAVEADNKEMVAQTLNSMGWYQSGHGDIDLAFKSYEEALSMGEHLDFYVLNDAMVNTATLYIVHGDEEYVLKGIELLKQSIERIKEKLQEEQASAENITTSIVIPQFNIGVAYTLHLYDYENALQWFKIINGSDISISHLKMSSLLFSALSAVELGRNQEAEAFLARSYKQPQVNNTEFSYLYCYRELVKFKLQQEADLNVCLPLHPNVPLEVKIDVYKRLSELKDDAIRNQGQEKFYELYNEKLESQMKHSASSTVSTVELHRLQQESRLKNELLEKEIALKTALQERQEGQIRLVIALSLILMLLILITVIRLNQKRRLAEQFEKLSVIDVLTGLNNRRFLEQNIEREMGFIKRSQVHPGAPVMGVYLIDIDHFKRVNDTYGHAAGDKALVGFAQRINETIRDADLFVRWGGEEFLLVARLEQAEGLQVLAQRLIDAVKREPYQVLENQSIDLTCTIGSVIYPSVAKNEKDISWNNLVKLADLALYYGKQKQRDCWVCIENVSKPESWNALFAQDFEQSLSNKQITLSTSITEPKE
ncbi:MAG TPA: GGDEF domain-containing protein [Kangiella sp.]